MKISSFPISFMMIDYLRGINSSKWYNRLKLIEKQNTEEIQKYQFDQLRKLLNYVSKHVPYYVEYFQNKSLNLGSFKTIEDLHLLPIITKRDFRKNPTPFLSDRFNKKDLIYRSTSGATSEPFIYFLDKDSFGFTRACRHRFWEWFGYELGEKYCTISGSSLISNNKSDIKLQIYDYLEKRVSCLVGRLDEKKMQTIISAIMKTRPKYLFGYPSLLHTISKYIEENEIAIDFIKVVITTSECLAEENRKYIEKAFNSEVYDFYGCGDGTVVASECEIHQGLHYAMEGSILECVSADGYQVKPGSEGRIIATSLTNFSMPFIRYDTSDMGNIETEKCSCGRSLHRIGHIMGRDRDQILSENGSLVHGAVVNKIALKNEWISKFQIIQKQDKQVKVLVEPKYEPEEYEKQLFLNTLKEILGDIPISLIFTSEFVLKGSGKFRSIISEAAEKDYLPASAQG